MGPRILALLLCGGSAALMLGAPDMLPERTVQIPRDFAGQRLPRFNNGFVLAYDFDFQVVWSYDRAGSTLMEVPLSVPEANRVLIGDIAASPDGTVAVSGSATSDGGYTTVPAIFWIGPSGKVTRIVRTEPFAATAICFSTDGTLWAAGRAHEIVNGIYKELPEYDVLRQYDAQGRLVRTALPRATFPAGVGTRATIPGAGPAASPFLVTSKERIGFYSGNANRYVELSLSGEVLGSWDVAPPPQGTDVVGAALTSSGRMFLTGSHPRSSREPPAEWELLLYELDKSSGALRRVDFPQTGPHRATALLSAEGDDLVFYSKPPASISWFAAPSPLPSPARSRLGGALR